MIFRRGFDIMIAKWGVHMRIIKEEQKKTYQTDTGLMQTVAEILNHVRNQGDAALAEYAEKFDGIHGMPLEITKEDVQRAYAEVPAETVEYLKFAARQLENYAKNQLACLHEMEMDSEVEGIRLGHRLIPVETCGCYVPGGRYPLPSSALMSVLTAKIAGVKNVYACCPPSKQHGTVHPVVLAAMDIAGAG